GGSLASGSASGAVATLPISEGAAAPDTAVGAFIVAHAATAAGIRAAAGNLSSFAASSPADGAKPVLVAGTLAMKDVDGNGRVDQIGRASCRERGYITDAAAWTDAKRSSEGTRASARTTRAGRSRGIPQGAA